MSEGGAGKTEAAAGDSDHINLRVVAQDGNEVFFKIKSTTPLRKLMDAYIRRNQLQPDSVRFLFDGVRVQSDKTPKEVGMEDGDVIDVVLQQTGGY
eukprot:TRINITY_DN2690_c0_g1_i1.p2 TRINITY_DN2690_c0_g1~~TRINITY_DN2690_c0_g1_i1.p2  ORF type:complete len:111 (+),score=29.05 TRINITY_DN2690_c0_g1_i1:46-333(+)